ncbi:MAG: NAD(P)H-dependent oxidoreductase [Planctomycetota bacterium]|nr:NAD(P)H-dependent oxidoreductase [Planctomycetota bacterium]
MARIVVLYSSLGGNTRQMAEHVAAGARLVPGVEVTPMDAAALDLAALESADGIAIGAPNYFSYPSGLIKHFFDLAHQRAAFKGKPYVAFSTHGGGGGISPVLEKLSQAVGMKPAAAGLDVMGLPQGDQVKDCRKLGQALAVRASS